MKLILRLLVTILVFPIVLLAIVCSYIGDVGDWLWDRLWAASAKFNRWMK